MLRIHECFYGKLFHWETWKTEYGRRMQLKTATETETEN